MSPAQRYRPAHPGLALPCFLLAAGLLVASAGCGRRPRIVVPPSCDLPQAVNLTIQASDRVNLDENGESLPTIVRVYQLKKVTAFENAEFEDIWLRGEDTLGKDLLQMDEFTVYPTQRLDRPLKRNPEAAYVVGMGVFRRPAGISWRTIFELPPSPREAKCKAQSKDPEAKPEAGPDPRFFLLVEDYRIEAMDEPPPDAPKKTPPCCSHRVELP